MGIDFWVGVFDDAAENNLMKQQAAENSKERLNKIAQKLDDSEQEDLKNLLFATFGLGAETKRKRYFEGKT